MYFKDVVMDKDNPKSKMGSVAMHTVFGKRYSYLRLQIELPCV